jgi:hypothetical protein
MSMNKEDWVMPDKDVMDKVRQSGLFQEIDDRFTMEIVVLGDLLHLRPQGIKVAQCAESLRRAIRG